MHHRIESPCPCSTPARGAGSMAQRLSEASASARHACVAACAWPAASALRHRRQQPCHLHTSDLFSSTIVLPAPFQHAAEPQRTVVRSRAVSSRPTSPPSLNSRAVADLAAATQSLRGSLTRERSKFFAARSAAGALAEHGGQERVIGSAWEHAGAAATPATATDGAAATARRRAADRTAAAAAAAACSRQTASCGL